MMQQSFTYKSIPFAVRTGSGSVDHDPWRQWQAFAALLSSANPASQARSAGNSAFGFAPFIEAAERFNVARGVRGRGLCSRGSW
jgi:hypothetical protein